MQRSHRPSCQAFTLIEILVVVGVMGIAAMIVVPQLLKPGHMTLQAAGRVVIQDILIAQNEAIAQQTPRRVVFEPAQNRYRLTDDQGITLGMTWKGAGSENYITNFSSDGRFAGVRMENVSFGDDMTIEYDDLGTPSVGGSMDLVSNDMRYRIRVAAITGRVTIERIE